MSETLKVLPKHKDCFECADNPDLHVMNDRCRECLSHIDGAGAFLRPHWRPHVFSLKELLVEQTRLQEAMGWPIPANEAGAVQNIDAAIVELVEVKNELNWKPWKKSKKEVDLARVAEEITDVLQFLANTAISLGLTAEDLSVALRRKLVTNHARVKAGY